MNKIAIFDLDDTLYKSEKIRTLFENSIYSSISESLSVSCEKAKELFIKKRKEIKNKTGINFGSTQTLYSFFEVSINNFEKQKLKQISLMGMPNLNTNEINTELKISILKLSDYYKPVLLTNNHLSITELVLNKINLNQVFDSIYTLNDMPNELAQKIKNRNMPFDKIDEKVLSYMKPSKERIINIISKYNADPCNSVSIGDRYSIDHLHPDELGMKIFIVEKVEDVINACKELSENT